MIRFRSQRKPAVCGVKAYVILVKDNGSEEVVKGIQKTFKNHYLSYENR